MRKDACFRSALSYLDRGWASLALCPPRHQDVTDYHTSTCTNPGKRPLGRWKAWQFRLPTLEELAAQFELVPRANVGVVMGQVSGLVGIDVDGQEGLRLLQEVSGEKRTPGTLAFRTARGMRLLYSLEAGMRVGSWSIHQEEGELKVLGEGSLTVMPPSRHVSGKRYSWIRGKKNLAVVPEWVLRRPGGGKVRRSGSQKVSARRVGILIPEGQRNERLFRIGCAMRGRGRSEEEILAEIGVVNQRCVPPLDEAELVGIARSVVRYEALADLPAYTDG